jgi:trafficking protein particle complex subunit 12
MTLLDSLLSEGEFLSVAYLSAAILVSGSVQRTDTKMIFDLLALRFSCLELTGNAVLAAQEAKSLEDLTSTFYYLDVTDILDGSAEISPEQPPPHHIMPFALRLQALRLQSIGFSDPRRGLTALFDLGLECRENITSSFTPAQEREIWNRRLAEVGIKVVNALIEMGDLECAGRMLASLQPNESDDPGHRMRKALLYLKIGDTTAARNLIERDPGAEVVDPLMQALLSFTEGRYDDARNQFERCLRTDQPAEQLILTKQNLAVAMLYTGNVEKTKAVMQELVGNDHVSQSLIFNLATLYELGSDKSKDLKLALADRLAANDSAPDEPWIRANSTFKL